MQTKFLALIVTLLLVPFSNFAYSDSFVMTGIAGGYSFVPASTADGDYFVSTITITGDHFVSTITITGDHFVSTITITGDHFVSTITITCYPPDTQCPVEPTPEPETPESSKPSQSSPSRSSGGGGGSSGGGGTRTNVDVNAASIDLKLYKVSWNCDDNLTTIVTDEGDPEVTILGYDGKVIAVKSDVQNLEDRTIFTANHYDKLLSVSITSIEGRFFERIFETIRADACVGEQVFTEYREKTVMQAPTPDTTPELETEPEIIPDEGLQRDPKPIPVP